MPFEWAAWFPFWFARICKIRLIYRLLNVIARTISFNCDFNQSRLAHNWPHGHWAIVQQPEVSPVELDATNFNSVFINSIGCRHEVLQYSRWYNKFAPFHRQSYAARKIGRDSGSQTNSKQLTWHEINDPLYAHEPNTSAARDNSLHTAYQLRNSCPMHTCITQHVHTSVLMNESIAASRNDARCQSYIQIKLHIHFTRWSWRRTFLERICPDEKRRNNNQKFSTWFSDGHCRRRRIPVTASVLVRKAAAIYFNGWKKNCNGHQSMEAWCTHQRPVHIKPNEYYWKWNETHHYRALVAVIRFIIMMIDHRV